MSNARTFTHYSTGETQTTTMTNEELFAKFAETADASHWLWFHLTKHVNGLESAAATKYTMTFLADMFLLSIGMGLKSPMVRVHRDNRRYKIYLSKRGNVCVKSGALIEGTQDPTGDEEYMGGFWRERFNTPGPNSFKGARSLLPTEQEFLDELLQDPTGNLAKWGKDMARCTFCYRALEDERSMTVGYGRNCAQRFGLPWSKKQFDQNVPTFAKVWSDSPDVQRMCAAIRAEPNDPFGWMVLGDALEEAGCVHKKPAKPERLPTIPQC